MIALVFLAVILTALGANEAERAPALTVRDARPVSAGELLAAEVRLGGLFSPRVRQSLERALPASLMVTVDVWRDRRGWFDQLVESRSILYRIRYDAWREDFDVARDREEETHLGALASVADSLMRPMIVPLMARSKLTPRHRYYLVVTASLRPLTPEGLREIEDFLSHQSGNGHGRPGPFPSGSIASLPRSVFSVLAALSGLGDEIASKRTAMFEPQGLRPYQ